MTSYAEYIARISFRFVQPHTPPEDEGWYVLQRQDGSSAKLLDIPGIPLDMINTNIPENEQGMKRALGGISNIPKMSTFAIGAMINRGISLMPENQAFINVGIWHGFTFLAGIVNNPQKICVGIDNFSQFGGPRDAFIERFRKYKSHNHFFYEMDYADYFRDIHRGLIGFYIYDGEHSYDNQLRGLQVAEAYFAEDCIILVDDTNWVDPRQAVIDFVAKSSYGYRILLDKTTCCNGHPTLWNGIVILQRTKDTSTESSIVGFEGSSRPATPLDGEANHETGEVEANRRVRRRSHGEMTISDPPLVSIIIDNYSNGRSLEKTIDSALHQTYSNTELIVVDDGSTDNSREVIASYGGRITRVQEWRQSLSFEAGFAASRGTLVCFLDSGEILLPNAVEMGISSQHESSKWASRLHMATQEIVALVPPGDAFILVDQAEFGTDVVPGRRAIPFLERDGQYWGAPPDDETAVQEFERLRQSGTSFIVFAWPAFWWLDYYSELHRQLRANFRCVLENDRLVAFYLRQ